MILSRFRFFKSCPHPRANQFEQLSNQLGLRPTQIKFWFQNRRTGIKDDELSKTLENITGKGIRNPEMESVLAFMRTGSFCTLLDFDPGYTGISTAHQLVSLGRDKHKLMIEIGCKAMDELIWLLNYDESVWIKSLVDGRHVLNEDIYNKSFEKHNHVKSITSFTESSKYSGLVGMSAPHLFGMFMDSNKWVELFPTLVTDATTIKVLDTTMLRDHAGSMQLMYEKMHTLSPLVSPREFHFIRYCKKVNPGLFVMVDVSYDSLGRNPDPTKIKCWRKPSGCMIKVRSDGISEVMWMEHVEVDHDLYKESIQSYTAYGAQRWIVTLQRMIGRLSCLALTNSRNFSIQGGMTPQGRAILMNTTHKMVKAFFKRLSKCEKLDLPDPFGMENGDLRVSVRPSDVPGAVLVSASSSLRLSVPRTAIFNYLNDQTSRFQWDMFTHSNSIKANVDISYGSYPGNRVSIFQPSSLGDNNAFIIQESYNDPLESLIAYVPVPIQWLKSVITGEGSNLPILPAGFIITDGGHMDHHADVASSTSSNKNLGASILTMFYQTFVDPITKREDTAKAIADVDEIITTTMFNIKTALYEKALIS